MGNLHSPVVLISGGGGGIGSAVAARFGQEGARIALADQDESLVQKQVSMLRSKGIEAAGWRLDVTDPEACDRVVGEAVGQLGSLDILVHCAGITQVSAFRDTRLEVFRRVMEVNFFGAVSLTQAAIEPLIVSRGRIVLLSSIAGFAPLLGRAGYCASKHALHGCFDTVRAELAREGVRVTIVCPSFVDTDFASKGLRADGARIDFQRSTTGRALTPQQVAEAIYRACRTNQRLVVLPRLGRVVYWLSRLAPAWYDRLMTRRFDVELDRK